MTSGGFKGGFQLTTKQYPLLIIHISVTKRDIPGKSTGKPLSVFGFRNN